MTAYCQQCSRIEDIVKAERQEMYRTDVAPHLKVQFRCGHPGSIVTSDRQWAAWLVEQERIRALVAG